MGEWLDWFLSAGFMPHGHCYLWLPALVWLEVASNLAIGLAYVSISATLATLVRRIRDLPFQWVYVAFGVFIITCGFTHFMDVWVIWHPTYWLDAGIRVVTAIASVGTAVLLFPLFPKVIALAEAARTMRSRGVTLEQMNAELLALYEGTREALAEAIPQLVWTATPAGEIDFVNRRWVAYFGARPGPGWTFADAAHPGDAEACRARWEMSRESGEPFEIECQMRGHEGGYRWFLVRARRVTDREGRAVRWFGTMTDIQDSKLAAAAREEALASAREAVRARDVFLAVAAHELRTPLTPLRLEVEGLRRTAIGRRAERVTPAWVAERAAGMERHVRRLERLVDELLDVARIAGGKLELKLAEVDVGEVVSDVVARHAAEIARSASAVTVAAEPGIVGRFDRARLEQVVTNLLVNALKYGGGEPVHVEARAEGGRAVLRVRDRGIGIAPESQARIFGQFERAASERHYGGLGLGLWIVRQIVEAFGGSVRVASSPGEGSTFTVELPLATRPPA